MPARSHDERALIARIASNDRWGRIDDRAAAMQPAHRGLRAKFEREADPDNRLSPDERARRADSLMRAHMLRMSLKSAQSRRRAREHLNRAEAAEAELREFSGGAA